MTEVRCLCEQCKMTVMQCRGRSAKSDAVLEELEKFVKSKQREAAMLENKSTTDVGQVAMNGRNNALKEVLKKIEELRTKER